MNNEWVEFLQEGKLYRMTLHHTWLFKGVGMYVGPSLDPFGFKFLTPAGNITIAKAQPNIFDTNSPDEYFERVL